MPACISVKKLVYKELQPMAQAVGCQMILLDSKTYKPYTNKLEQKMRVLGIESDQYRELIDAVEEHGCVAILKSKKHYGPSEIASAFSSIGLEEHDVHILASVNAKHYPIWGDLDASIPEKKAKFFWWFAVSVENEDGEVVMEDDETHRTVAPIEVHGIRGILTVGDVLKTISSVFEGQGNGFLNVGLEGKIFGQVNNVYEDVQPFGTFCIMTLAPYKNGMRVVDASIDGLKSPPMKLHQIEESLSAMPKHRTVHIKYRDPYAFGPRAGRVVEGYVDHIDIDKEYGVFMRLSVEVAQKTVSENIDGKVWVVEFIDRDEDGIQVAHFKSKEDADNWVKSQEMQERFDPSGFEVVRGPYQDSEKSALRKQMRDIKVWLDASKKPPEGYDWVKSLDEFIDYAARVALAWKTLEPIKLVDISIGLDIDGRPTFDILRWLKSHGLDNIEVAVHGEDMQQKKALEDKAKRLGFKAVQQVSESKKPFDAHKYIEDFKDEFGYQNDYFPEMSYRDAADNLAHECALKMPYDTEARETNGNAVMLLVSSGAEEGIAAGKALGDFMMKHRKHERDEEKLLDLMSDAYKALNKVASREEAQIRQPINENVAKTKIWIDDVRNAPNGYVWIKSTNDFINYVEQEGVQSIDVIDIDHDAGEYASNGGDYIKCLDYLEFIGAQDVNVRIHSANPVGVAKMRQIVKRNGWREVFDIRENTVYQCIAKQIIDQFSKDLGIDCSVDIVDNAHVNVHGNFDDKFPLDCLTFYWTPKDEYHEYGWHEGTKCMNKWRSLGAETMNRVFLDGLNMED